MSQSHGSSEVPAIPPASQPSDFGEVVFSYTRAQAIEDGVLTDITEAVKKWFKVPVAVTSRVWALVETNEVATVEDLAMTILGAIHRQKEDSDTVYFTYLGEPMWALMGPGDTVEPVLTVMMRDED